MIERMPRRNWLTRAIVGSVAVAAGCGTMLYPERRGQPAGRIDWRVVALDAVLLLFFFIPGVVAFAVDFATGAIYMPVYCAEDESRPSAERQLATLHLPRWQLTPRGIAQAVSRQLGRPVELVEGQYQTQELARVDEFWATHDRLAG